MNMAAVSNPASNERYQLYDMEVRSFDRYAFAKYEIIKEWLSPYQSLSILSVGCGSGELSHMLAQLGHKVFGIDVNEQYVRMASEKSRELGLERCLFKTASIEEFRTDELFDVVLSTDVLEHIHEDEKMVEKMVSFLKPDGLMVITVPAGLSLYGHHDIALGHYRRYSIQSLKRTVGRHIQITDMRYFGFFLIPVTILYSKLLKKMYPVEIGKPSGASPLLRLVDWILAVEKRLRFPAGTALLAMGKVSLREGQKDYLEHCILCGTQHGRFRNYCDSQNYNLVQCGACGLIFVNPRDDQHQISSQYLDDQTSPINYYLSAAKTDEVNFHRRLRLIEQIAKKGKLLDIGCNVGTFLDAAKKRGWETAGLDANKNACQICKEKGHRMMEGLFSEKMLPKLKDEKFDLVSLNDAIEHFPDPSETLNQIAGFMPDGGCLAVNVPNIDSFLTKIFQIKPKEHLFYFNRHTLKTMLEKSGFEIVVLKETGRRRDIGAMHRGASIGRRWLILSRVLGLIRIDFIVSILLDFFFQEDLFVIARKTVISDR